MKNIYRLLISILLVLSMTGCHAFVSGDSGAESADTKTYERNVLFFDSVFVSEIQQSERVVNALLDLEQKSDCQGIIDLFAPSVAASSTNLKEAVEALIDFVQGDIVEIEGVATNVYESVEGKVRTTEYHASFDITTTQTNYRFALQFFTKDSSPDNIGLHSLYAILEENTEARFAYWGNNEWKPGVIIEQAPLP